MIDDEATSEVQENWQDIARRLRMLIDRTVARGEQELAKGADNDCLAAEALHNLSTAALSAFALERQASSYDCLVRRDSGGF